MLSDLIPGTKYTISITAVANETMKEENLTYSLQWQVIHVFCMSWCKKFKQHAYFESTHLVLHCAEPAVVGNLSITDVTTSSVSLNWDKPVGNATSYRIQWTLGGSTFSDSSTDTSFNITGLTPGSQYNITVSAVAVDSSNEGESILKTTFTRKSILWETPLIKLVALLLL